MTTVNVCDRCHSRISSGDENAVKLMSKRINDLEYGPGVVGNFASGHKFVSPAYDKVADLCGDCNGVLTYLITGRHLTYEQAREICEAVTYVPYKQEGAPCHPAGWATARGMDHDKWYRNTLDAYIKHYYQVEPPKEELGA